jgi:outer membrane biosynthesis protein TonB
MSFSDSDNEEFPVVAIDSSDDEIELPVMRPVPTPKREAAPKAPRAGKKAAAPEPEVESELEEEDESPPPAAPKAKPDPKPKPAPKAKAAPKPKPEAKPEAKAAPAPKKPRAPKKAAAPKPEAAPKDDSNDDADEGSSTGSNKRHVKQPIERVDIIIQKLAEANFTNAAVMQQLTMLKKQLSGAKIKPATTKRPPNAFNLYVRDKMIELKENNMSSTERFKECVRLYRVEKGTEVDVEAA